MARPPIVFDLTRLFIGPVQITPRGIDRVELGFAGHFLKDWPGDAMGVLPTPLGARAVSRAAALRLIEAVCAQWGEGRASGGERLLEPVRDWLVAAPRPAAPMRRKRRLHATRAIARMAGQLGLAAGPLARDALPLGAIYLNTGQVGLAIPRFLSWLRQRSDIKPVFMLHDVIPIDHARYVSSRSTYFHRNMLASTAAHAAGLIVTTRDAGAAIGRELQALGRADIPVIAEPLPVDPAFAAGPCPDGALAATAYFVVVGSIEARKNHLLLLRAWRDLIAILGPACPRLIIAGTRWRGHDATTDMLAQSPALRSHVLEVGGLSTPALHRLLSNSRGLLMPSFAEGFGLPIIEAQALGVPVIASDIPAHREAGGDSALYLDPADAGAWAIAIRGLSQGGGEHPTPRQVHTWPDYFRSIEPFLTTIAAAQSRLA